MHKATIVAAICAVTILSVVSYSARSQASAVASQLSFTAAQAQRGGDFYQIQCAKCHGTSLDNGENGVPLKGEYFQKRWSGKTAGEIFNFMREKMPPDKPGTLGLPRYADLLAFILSENDVAASDAELPSDPSKLESMKLN